MTFRADPSWPSWLPLNRPFWSVQAFPSRHMASEISQISQASSTPHGSEGKAADGSGEQEITLKAAGGDGLLKTPGFPCCFSLGARGRGTHYSLGRLQLQ